MPDVTIHRCVMRVVRRGGWSWGPEPKRLVADVVRALPALLAAELARILPEDAGGEVSAPVRLDVRIGLADLREWARRGARETQGAVAEVGGIAAAVRRALAAEMPAARLIAAPAPGAQPDAAAPVPDAHTRRAAVLNVLVAWRTAGALEELLRGLPDLAIATWHLLLLESGVVPEVAAREEPPARAVGGGTSQGPTTAGLASLLEPLAERAAVAAPIDRLRLRLLAAVELAVVASVPPANASARAAIDACLALEQGDGEARSRTQTRRTAGSGTRRAVSGTEVRVSSALPFLLLGPLRRIGWLDALDATFAAADLENALPALAVALATKVLPEPERGWRRTHAAAACAAAFAGDAEPRPDPEVTEVARIAAPLAPALDAVLRRSLLDGHRAGDPLLLCAAESVWLLVEPEGVFLMAHADDPEAVAARALETAALVFVPAGEADATMLAVLHAAGVTFVTPARPVRGELWHLVRGTHSPRLFTNGRAAAFVPPSETVAARAREVWLAFGRRPLPGRPPEPSLERALTLAAAVALGTISWELWRKREPTDPLLALERFSDLEGTVRFEERRVRVRLPLGKRYRDLKEAGFLEDVPRVPWLGFRPVVFAGG